MDLLRMWRSWRQLGDNVEELRDRVGENERGLPSAVLRVMSELWILSFLMMSKTSTLDFTSCVFYPVCTHWG